MAKVYVMESYELSTNYDKRYVVIDKDTGEILDDAQGYGYKSKSKAYAAWAYKNKNRNGNTPTEERDYYIKKWLEDNSDVIKLIDTFAINIKEGKYGKGAKFNARAVMDFMNEHNIEVDFTPAELLHVYKKLKKEESNGR